MASTLRSRPDAPPGLSVPERHSPRARVDPGQASTRRRFGRLGAPAALAFGTLLVVGVCGIAWSLTPRPFDVSVSAVLPDAVVGRLEVVPSESGSAPGRATLAALVDPLDLRVDVTLDGRPVEVATVLERFTPTDPESSGQWTLHGHPEGVVVSTPGALEGPSRLVAWGRPFVLAGFEGELVREPVVGTLRLSVRTREAAVDWLAARLAVSHDADRTRLDCRAESRAAATALCRTILDAWATAGGPGAPGSGRETPASQVSRPVARR